MKLEFYDTYELAELLHVSRQTLKVWRMKGQGPAWVKAGQRVLYRRNVVDKWLKSSKTVGDR